MEMVGDQRPRVTPGFSFAQQFAEPLQEIFTIRIVAEDLAPFYSSGDYVM
jgi:hypothetical protein